MREKKVSKLALYLYGVILFGLVAAGGFFEYISCILIVLLLIPLLYLLFKKKDIRINQDYSLFIVFLICISYLVVSIWAVDCGMAILGFFKFLPVLLFYILLSYVEEDRDWMIQSFPAVGAIITIVSYIMMQFAVFKNFVSVAGRLAGSFQYPNTFALFLLVCLLVALWQKNKIKYLYIFILAFGIIQTGSRTVIVIAAISLIVIACSQRNHRKELLGISAALLGAFVLFIVIGWNTEFVLRIRELPMQSSTFLGRLLYYKDAIPVILKHPFGLGYYGYYFMEQEIQTGVYSILNVHNELLQFMLDIGIIPALLFYGMMVKQIFSKNNTAGNRAIWIVILLHSLFDYDFQFIGFLLVLILFIPYSNIKKLKVGGMSYSVVGIASAVTLIGSGIYGLSGFFYIRGNNQMAYSIGKFNTMAQMELLTNAETVDEMRSIAENIIKRNKHVAVAYGAIAKSYCAAGDIKEFINYELKYLKMAPYQQEAYLEYLDYLVTICRQYIDHGEMESARICVKRMLEVKNILSEVADHTSELAWKIDDTPILGLPGEYLNAIDTMIEAVNE